MIQGIDAREYSFTGYEVQPLRGWRELRCGLSPPVLPEVIVVQVLRTCGRVQWLTGYSCTDDYKSSITPDLGARSLITWLSCIGGYGSSTPLGLAGAALWFVSPGSTGGYCSSSPPDLRACSSMT
jgi:hypothetical protein